MGRDIESSVNVPNSVNAFADNANYCALKVWKVWKVKASKSFKEITNNATYERCGLQV